MSRGLLNEIGFTPEVIERILQKGRELRESPRDGTRLITNEEFWALTFNAEISEELDKKLNDLNILLVEIQNLVYTNNDADKHYIHNQEAASNNWIVNHNLGKRPSVTVVDTGDNEVEGDVYYNSLNQLTIIFSSPFSGKAYLN